MEYAIIAFAAFFISFITFYSGFGLGTVLMPVIAIFFPLPIAIGLTAIVHLLHNGLKTAFLFKSIDWKVALQFGSAAVIAAIPGSWMLKKISLLAPLKSYTWFSLRLWSVTEQSILHHSILLF
jgi:hypothetical protein